MEGWALVDAPAIQQVVGCERDPSSWCQSCFCSPQGSQGLRALGAGEKFADFLPKFLPVDSNLGHASEKAGDLGRMFWVPSL